jgi:hypothetical protein
LKGSEYWVKHARDGPTAERPWKNNNNSIVVVVGGGGGVDTLDSAGSLTF